MIFGSILRIQAGSTNVECLLYQDVNIVKKSDAEVCGGPMTYVRFVETQQMANSKSIKVCRIGRESIRTA